MRARDWFESIRAGVIEVRRMEGDIESIEARMGPHGQSVGSVGGGGSHDGMRGVDRIVDAGMRERLARQRSLTTPQIEMALRVLYGRDGRGGLARARSATDADILCCYYLQGMEWAAIAKDVARPDVARPNGWVRMRAMRALAFIDRMGYWKLARG